MERIALAQAGRGTAPRMEQLRLDQVGDRDLLAEMLAGTLGGVILVDALGAQRAAAVADWLEVHPGPAGPLRTPPFPGRTYGSVLVMAQAQRPAYHAHSAALLAAFATMPEDPMVAMRAALQAATGAAPVRPPTGEHGIYAPATVRVLDPGVGVALHSERDNWEPMDEIRAQADTRVQLSTYAPLRMGQGGGELLLYHRPPQGQAPHIEGLRDSAAHDALASFGVTIVRPRVGDLLVFAGGRFNHQVTPCHSGQRWTMGSFLAPAADGDGYLWWS